MALSLAPFISCLTPPWLAATLLSVCRRTTSLIMNGTVFGGYAGWMEGRSIAPRDTATALQAARELLPSEKDPRQLPFPI